MSAGSISAAIVLTVLVGTLGGEPPVGVHEVAVSQGRRVAALQPFAADSPWNTPIGSRVRFAAAGSPSTQELTAEDGSEEINSTTWSHPIFQASESDPLQEVDLESGQRLRYRIPQYAVPADGEDAHLHVIEPQGRYVHEAWGMRRTGSSTWFARHVVVVDLYGDGISGGARAYGGSAIGGLIRRHEVDEGVIPHALALAVPRSDLRSGPVWPATLEDDGSVGTYKGDLPMGALVAIPPDVDLESLDLNDDALAIARALQDYGAYVVDSSAQFTLYAEPGADEQRLDDGRKELDVLRRHLRVVENNTQEQPGGSGVKRRQSALPLLGEAPS